MQKVYYDDAIKHSTMNRKTIRLRKEVKERLDAFADGRSSNRAMKMLLEDAQTFDCVDIPKQEYYNIKIDEDLLDKLNRCRMNSRETHSDIVSRLLDEYPAEKWPFHPVKSYIIVHPI